MNNLSFAFSTLFPLFVMLSIGYLIKQLHWIQENSVKQMNKVCFMIFLPMSLFINVYQSQLHNIDWRFIGYGLISVIVSLLFILLIVNRCSLHRTQKGVMIQGIFRSNFILFGLPLTISFYGPDRIGTTAVLIAFVIPLYNILSIVVLNLYQQNHTNAKTILMESFKNPLIIGSLIAFLCIILKVKLPPFMIDTCTQIANAATPLALTLLGASFAFNAVKKNIKVLIPVVCAKLVIVPAFLIDGAILIGFRNEALLAIMAMSASPTAVSSFTMAQNMNMDDELAGQIVVFTTIFSIITLFCWITMIKSFPTLL